MKALLILINCCLVLFAFSQTTKVRGKVFDEETKEAIPLAKVFFQDTKTGTTTDFDGNFSLESYYVSDSLVIRASGYQTYTLYVDTDLEEEQTFNIALSPVILDMEEVQILPPDEAPSTILHKKIVRNKKINNKEKLEAYEFESYNKIQLDLNNLGEDFEQRKVIQKLDVLADYLDSDTSGKILPMIMSESFSNFYYRTNPSRKKEVMIASRVTGVDNLELSQFTGEMYQDINVYDNYITIFDKSFISPIAGFARSFYYFILEDSATIDGNWCYKLSFRPKTRGDLSFVGEMWVHDTTYAVKSWQATVAEKANINFIKDFYIEQEFDQVEKEVWMLTRDKLVIDFNVTKKSQIVGFYGRKLTTRKKFVINKPHDLDFYKSNDNVEVADDATEKSEAFWKENRHEPLSETEEGIQVMVDSLNNTRFFNAVKNTTYMLTTGFYPWKKIEIGNYQSLIGYNPVEGIRNQLQLRTSNNFSKRIEFSGKLAYGFRDQRFKYGGKVRYNITPKKRGILSLYYNYDIEQIGLAPSAADVGATFGALLRTAPLDKLTFVERTGIKLEKDVKKDLILTFGTEWKEFTPLGKAIYQRNTPSGIETINRLQTTEFTIKVRYGKNEEFLSGSFDRTSLGSKWPILSFQTVVGVRGILGADYNYQKFEGQILHSPKIGLFGKLNYNIYAGIIEGNAAYPFLKVHEGSQSLWLQTEAYNKMDFFEFISDKYVGMHLEHHWDGFILDRIPLIRSFKWRMVTSARGVYGSISQQHIKEMILPPNTKMFGNIPYVETGIGIENILKFGRIDAIWRLTHLTDGRSPFTIRARFVFSF
ncbi:DUF5686 and carboxypeptidase-like regulatory domain-containing protein [Lishizhenia sp.]|uniref:DUF5686 and carboxypeptidase-like regulatory domain-containing protein n=1 Tax=Lishizhenia sp. TaxID=2497594 RepID=UPI00299ECFA8|nr:DUF5686 family protein [Lishizhenia sp.]MDX1445887.1 DUF5686 family protein [Lishizhenia sp.]